MKNNLVGVIDVGSNSVRLMLSKGSKTLEKHVETTKLAEGLAKTGILNSNAIERTVKSVCFFVSKAKSLGAKEIYIFATAAVRSSLNGALFTQKVFEQTGVRVEVVSGEKEAKLGVFGALEGKDGVVIDVGGASTEIVALKNSKIIYSKSIYVGAVNTTDVYGQNYPCIKNYLREKIKEYGSVPNLNFYAIGGTATSLASICIGEKVYDPKKVHGYKLTADKMRYLEEFLTSKTIEERQNIIGLQKGRAEIICSGLLILKSIMEEFEIKCLSVSEKDNLEGFLGYIQGRWQN